MPCKIGLRQVFQQAGAANMLAELGFHFSNCWQRHNGLIFSY
jgi:hypothetical protein